MSFDELLASDRLTVTMADIAPILQSDAQFLRMQAQSVPAKLGFPVIVIGSHVKVPRLGFIHYMRYGYAASPIVAYNAQEEERAMLIHEAIKLGQETGKRIRRKSWPSILSIEPTDSPYKLCIAYAVNKAPRRGWQPTAQDLIADDWEISNN